VVPQSLISWVKRPVSQVANPHLSLHNDRATVAAHLDLIAILFEPTPL